VQAPAPPADQVFAAQLLHADAPAAAKVPLGQDMQVSAVMVPAGTVCAPARAVPAGQFTHAPSTAATCVPAVQLLVQDGLDTPAAAPTVYPDGQAVQAGMAG